jgi:TolB-like protein
MYRLLLISTFLLLSLPALAGTKSSTKEIEIEAQGPTYQDAVNEALIEAISRVHGKSISSEKLSESAEISMSNEQQKAYFSGESYQSHIREKTQGMVLGFDVLKSEQLSEYKWSVLLNVKIADYKKSASADRQRIAVLPFRYSKNKYVLGGQSIKSESFVNTLTSQIIDKLVTTRKFAILDRDFDNLTQNELDRIRTTDVAPAELARLSQGLGADYVLVGSIETLNFNVTERTMRTSDKTFVNGEGKLQVSFRLIEVATSQIVFSGSETAVLTDKNLRNGAKAAASEISAQFISKVATLIVRDTTDQIYPLTIVGKQGDEVILSEGSSTLKVGQHYAVYRRIEKIIDPYTKEFAGWSEKLCGEVKITRVTSRLSYAQVIKQQSEFTSEIEPKTLTLKQIVKNKVATTKLPQVQKPIIQKESKDW